MKQAFIDRKDFNRMIKNLKKALRAPNANWEGRRNFLVECIHLEFKSDSVRCIACDGYRIHEEHYPAKTEDEFVCHIMPPRLIATSDVKISLDDENVAYVEFDDVRFSTKQPVEPLDVIGFDKIQSMIGNEMRFEVALNPKYLLDAVNAMKGNKAVILNVGNPISPVVLYPDGGMGTQTYGILPVRRRYPIRDNDTEDEQRKNLRLIQQRLDLILAHVPAISGEQGAVVWEKAIDLRNTLKEYLKGE